MKNLFLFSIAFLISGNSFSKEYPHIDDPKKILEFVDNFIEKPPFEEAFRCGAKIKYERNLCAKFCEPFSCKEVCDQSLKEETLVVSKCSKKSVSITESNGKIWFVVDKSRWYDLNFARAFFLAPLNGDFTIPGQKINKNRIIITSKKLETFKLQDKTELKAVRIFFTYKKWNEELKQYYDSPQSLVLGKVKPTQGLFLEHSFLRMSKPIGKVISIK